jgi:hypothetical protein
MNKITSRNSIILRVLMITAGILASFLAADAMFQRHCAKTFTIDVARYQRLHHSRCRRFSRLELAYFHMPSPMGILPTANQAPEALRQRTKWSTALARFRAPEYCQANHTS